MLRKVLNSQTVIVSLILNYVSEIMRSILTYNKTQYTIQDIIHILIRTLKIKTLTNARTMS